MAAASESNQAPRSVFWEKARGVLAGTCSGLMKLAVGQPFDTIKVRMQTEGGLGRFHGPLHCLRETLRNEGVRGLYKGSTPPLVGWTIIDSVMWGALMETRRLLQADPTVPLTIPQHYFAGLVGGLASCIVVTPFEQVKARLQVQYHDPASRRYTGPIDCVRKLVKNNGIIGGLYQGFAGTVFFRVFMSIYFGSYELYKRELSKTNLSPIVRNFVSGGFAATTLWVVSFPADLVKNRMMAQPDTKPRKYETLRQCIRDVYREEGIRAFYRGFTPSLMRSFPTNGAAFVAAELALHYLP